MAKTFLWYDLETFGRDPRKTRIAQFAGIRTDEQLNPIGEPINLFCKPADDLLPSPEATLITGITPQRAMKEGLHEAEFFARLHEQLSQPHTCSVGYNSIRFDDEFIRFGLYRNFYDAYEREWRNGNSRWDLLDVMRLMQALRPEGLRWPLREDGSPSFKLEHLAEANRTREGTAHEALSDVRAMIGMARKCLAAQPKLWAYALKLRDKRYASSLLDTINMTPILHLSGKYPAARHCAALVLPLARHPRIDSRVIVVDLATDPTQLLSLSVDDIADRLYTPIADLPEGEIRIPLKEVHTNKCPALVPMAYLRATDFERLDIDRTACLAHAERLRLMPDLAEKVRRVFATEKHRGAVDADAALYDGFFSDADKHQCQQVRCTPTSELASLAPRFNDPRGAQLLFRYRARNWPDSLDTNEQQQWNDYRRQRLTQETGLSEYVFSNYYAAIAAFRAQQGVGQAQIWLDALEAWGKGIEASL